MLVGEIGITRHEFLYEISFWEVQRIIKGYRRRDMLRNQLIAECVFAAMHVMRDSKGKTPKDFFPGLFDDEEDKDPVEPMSDEDHAYEQELMRRWEKAQQQKKAQK